MIGNVQDPVLAFLPFFILLLPLAGFIVLWIFGDAIQRQKEARGAAWLACGTVLASFGLSVWGLVRLLGLLPVEHGLRFYQPTLGQGLAEGLMWIEVGGFRVPFSVLLDPLSAEETILVATSPAPPFSRSAATPS